MKDLPIAIVALDPRPVDASDIVAIKSAKHPLEQLREEFEAIRDEWLDRELETHGYDCTVDPPVEVKGVWRHRDGPAGRMSAEDWASLKSFFGGYKAIREKAQRYIIARDFGEFDRDRALMLWKLQRQ